MRKTRAILILFSGVALISVGLVPMAQAGTVSFAEGLGLETAPSEQGAIYLMQGTGSPAPGNERGMGQGPPGGTGPGSGRGSTGGTGKSSPGGTGPGSGQGSTGRSSGGGHGLGGGSTGSGGGGGALGGGTGGGGGGSAPSGGGSGTP